MVTVMFLTGCSTVRNVGYLTNSKEDIKPTVKIADLRLQNGDKLSITVSDQDYKAIENFHKYVPSHKVNDTYKETSADYYDVDDYGMIKFPMVGEVKVSGLTLREVERLILEKIDTYMAKNVKPIVQARLLDFHVTVMGEVAEPKRVNIENENKRFNIFDALSSAGDMTIYGKRDNVKIIREDSLGKMSIHTLNLNDASIINSPYYYMKQNDIIYVEPNKTKAQESKIGESTGLWFSGISIAISLAGLIYSLIKL